MMCFDYVYILDSDSMEYRYVLDSTWASFGYGLVFEDMDVVNSIEAKECGSV